MVSVLKWMAAGLFAPNWFLWCMLRLLSNSRTAFSFYSRSWNVSPFSSRKLIISRFNREKFANIDGTGECFLVCLLTFTYVARIQRRTVKLWRFVTMNVWSEHTPLFVQCFWLKVIAICQPNSLGCSFKSAEANGKYYRMNTNWEHDETLFMRFKSNKTFI